MEGQNNQLPHKSLLQVIELKGELIAEAATTTIRRNKKILTLLEMSDPERVRVKIRPATFFAPEFLGFARSASASLLH